MSQQRLSIHSCLFLALQSVLILCINYYLLQKRAALPKPEIHTICGIQTQSVGRMLVGQAAVGFFLVLMTSGDGLLTSFTAPDRTSLWRRPHIQSEIISLPPLEFYDPLHKLKECYSYLPLDEEAGLETGRFLGTVRIESRTEFKF